MEGNDNHIRKSFRKATNVRIQVHRTLPEHATRNVIPFSLERQLKVPAFVVAHSSVNTFDHRVLEFRLLHNKVAPSPTPPTLALSMWKPHNSLATLPTRVQSRCSELFIFHNLPLEAAR